MPTPSSGGIFSYVLPTGNIYIDPVLSGSRWGEGSSTTTVTYSFPSIGSYWSVGDSSIGGYGPNTGAGEPWLGYQAFTEQDKAAVRQILGMISSYAAVNFLEVADNAATVGDLRFGFSTNKSQSSEAAHAYYPSGEYRLATFTGDAAMPSAGDVWITGKNVYTFNPVVGNYDYFTLTHEIGHALGLKHPFEATTSVRGQFGVMPSQFDATWSTVMSYNAVPGVKNSTVLVDVYPITLMRYDVEALQYLYGTNTTTSSGNNTYTFHQDRYYTSVIYDTGGNDTIVYDAPSGGATLDLRAGAWQSVGLPIDATDVFGRTTNTYTGLVEIIGAADSIENAIGGGGGDTLTGNSLSNMLNGRGGNDTLSGGSGNDLLEGGPGSDTLDGESGDDLLLVSDDGSYGAKAGVSNDGSPGTTASGVGADVSGKFYTLDSYNGSAGRDTMRMSDGATTISLDSFGLPFPTISNVEVIDAGGGDDVIDLTSQRFSYGSVALFGRDGNDVLWANAGNDVLNGGPGDDQIDGGAGNDTLIAGTGVDAILGGPGNDLLQLPDARPDYAVTRNANGVVFANSTSDKISVSGIERVQFGNAAPIGMEIIIGSIATEFDDVLIGTSSDDTIRGLGGNDTIRGNDGNDVLFGDAGADHLLGGNGNDGISGGAGDDRMEGGAGNDSFDTDPTTRGGADTMLGGSGNDLYVIFGDDVVVELPGDGIDTVIVQASYSIASLPDIERILASSGVSSIDLTGNETANLISGNDGINQLIALGGNDVLIGNGGDDTLDGGLGADRMEGGAGDDTYVVDRAANPVTGATGDIVFEGMEEADSGGIDLVRTTFKIYTLAVNVENLIYIGESGNFVGTGNGLANHLVGDVGNDILKGRGGNDTFSGGAGNDTLDGGDGMDTVVLAGNRTDYVFSRPDLGKVQIARKDGSETDLMTGVEQVQFADGSIGQVTLDDLLKNTASKFDDNYEGGNDANVFDGLAGNDSILGGGGNDSLSGGLGNDTLDGGSGDDMLTGGKGNDLYIVDSAKDVVTENLNEGTDTVKAYLAAYTLTDNVENLSFTGITSVSAPEPQTSGVIMRLSGGVAGTIAGDTLAISANGNVIATAVLNSNGGFNLDLIEPAAMNGVQLSFQVVHDGHLLTAVDSAGKPVTVTYAGVVDATKATTTAISATLGGIAETFAGTGNNLANTITGGAGNDTLDGSLGADKLIGGAGDDTYLVDRAASSMIDAEGNTVAIAGDRVVEIDANGSDTGGIDTIQTALATYTLASITNVENLTYTGENAFRGTGNTLNNLITGGVANDILAGGDGSDTLFGKGGNDILKGGNGEDVLCGEAGNDTLDGGNNTDTVILAGNRADYVFSRPDVGKVQVARNDGTETDLMTGVEQVQFADGSIGQVTLDDLLKNTASKFDDNYEGGNDANVFDGLAGNDSILGGGGNDALSGGLGNDTLNGGTGSDQLSGGLGNDLYFVDTDADPDPAKAIAGDVVSEALNAGIDKVQTSLAAYVLGNNIENLDYLGTPVPVLGADGKPTGTSQVQQLAFTGTGNNLANTITGSLGNDTLDGGLGMDKLIGGAGDDTYVVDRAASSLIDANGNSVYVPGDQTLEQDNAGIDTVRASTTNWTLAANVENLLYIGSDSFRGTGNLLANLITGNSANDTLSGLAENDILNGMDGNDRLLGGDGNDVLNGGQGDDTLNGSNDNDRLYGNEGSDVILGGFGDDTLTGGVGADTLTGGADADIFVFNNSPDANSIDLITDFKSGVDRMSLDTGIFGITDLNQAGLLVSNLADMTADTRLIYQYDAKAKSGMLYYDDDGLGDHAMVAVAKLAGVASLAAADFMVGVS